MEEQTRAPYITPAAVVLGSIDKLTLAGADLGPIDFFDDGDDNHEPNESSGHI